MFTAAVFTIAKMWKHCKCSSTDEWIKKMWCVCVYIYIYMYTHIHICIYTVKYYSAISNEILPLSTTCVDLESIMLSEINQTEKDKCCMISLTCGI